MPFQSGSRSKLPLFFVIMDAFLPEKTEKSEKKRKKEKKTLRKRGSRPSNSYNQVSESIQSSSFERTL